MKLSEIVPRTIVAHNVTYLVAGLLAYSIFDYPKLYSESGLRFLMRPTDDRWVMAGPLLQPVRGLLFGVAFYVLRGSLFAPGHGWWRLWMVLVIFGILGTFGPAPSSLEGLIYTHLPLSTHVLGLPEILAQSLLLSVILHYWVNHPRNRALNWGLGAAFVVGLLLPALGLWLRAQGN